MLLAALEQARAGSALIPATLADLQALVDGAGDDTERDARLYQMDLARWQLERAAELAQERLDYLCKIKTRADAQSENARCAADQIHWFKYYAFAIDPRPDAPLSLMPFALFPFQERFVEWLDYITFVKRTSGVVEKARDMGATETTLRWMLRNWRYREQFIGLLLSLNEDLVDSKKDPGTLFEKVRFQMRLLPQWMLPEGFDIHRDMPYMMLSNEANGSVLKGDAPTANVGRQRRATFVLADEFAAWPHGGYPQHTAVSRTSNTFCPVSSVQGKNNKYADLASDGRTARFEMDWRDHPWRDTRWYDALPFGYFGPAMTPEQIAQEVDRNYDASQPGRVLRNVKEEYCFITWEELVEGFKPYKLGHEFIGPDGRFKIPDMWNWGRVADYGESARTEDDTHVWAYSLLARPQEYFPFTDSLFFFYSLPIEPIGATELEGFAFYSELERELGLRGDRGFIRHPSLNDMSHEATDPKDVLLRKCGDSWNIPDLDFDKGRRKLVFHFELTDKHLPNPFRPALMGRSRIYFVAPPEEYFLAKNERTGAYFVTPSQTQRGFKRLRREIGAWHYPPEERGKPVPKMRPKPVYDDVITTVRYTLARWGVGMAPLTRGQRTEKAIAEAVPELTHEAIEKLDEHEKAGAIHKRIIVVEKLKQAELVRKVYDQRARAKLRRRRGR